MAHGKEIQDMILTAVKVCSHRPNQYRQSVPFMVDAEELSMMLGIRKQVVQECLRNLHKNGDLHMMKVKVLSTGPGRSFYGVVEQQDVNHSQPRFTTLQCKGCGEFFRPRYMKNGLCETCSR